MLTPISRRGPKPKGKVEIKWSPDFAYAIGLLATDGCVYRDGRYLDFTSKDLEQIQNFMKSLDLNIRISKKKNGQGSEAYRLQWSDISFVNFLNSIGITCAKSLTLQSVKVPDEYFLIF
ncbi:MAG: LAGLIDADG family homing endonuclease [Candidatus Taylorbacteria bacterium]